jgi:uncharacterized protein YbjT (DUF2867 family)
MIVVTGAGGRVGGLVVAALDRRGCRFGRPCPLARRYRGDARAVRAPVHRGEAGVVGDDFRRLTGKEPLSIAEVISLHRDEMPLASR